MGHMRMGYQTSDRYLLGRFFLGGRTFRHPGKLLTIIYYRNAQLYSSYKFKVKVRVGNRWSQQSCKLCWLDQTLQTNSTHFVIPCYSLAQNEQIHIPMAKQAMKHLT